MSSVGTFASLVLTITSAVLLSYVIHDNASILLAELKNNTAQTQLELYGLMARLPGLQSCEVALLNNTAYMNNCSTMAGVQLANNTDLLTNKTATLAMHTVASFNATVNTAILQACARVEALQTRLLYATTNQTTAVPNVLQNGTVSVSLVGGDSFPWVYELRQLVLGNDLRMTYLWTPKWNNSLTMYANVTDPVFKYGNFTPAVVTAPVAGADVFKPLLRVQSEAVKWSLGTNIVTNAYRWNSAAAELEFRSVGAAAPYNLAVLQNDLNLIFQFL